MILIFALMALGSLGLLGMTWLFPSLARILWLLTHKRGAPESRSSAKLLRIAVLIPAHNEELSIGRTLASVRAAIARNPHDVRVLVGADGCTDRTAQLARAAGAEVVEFAQQGKWRTLKALLRSCSGADWVVFVDAGIEWPADFLAKATERFRDPEVMAVAPSYRVSDGGALEQALWSVERHFKAIEARAGGPVSIHGATVAYRRAELAGAFAALGDRAWLNDDVVIPLTLRSRHPGLRIHYASDVFVVDRFRSSAPAAQGRELSRRKRLVKGNIQWAPRAFERGGIASVLALRRIFRLFWAYWALAFAFGAGLFVLRSLPLEAVEIACAAALLGALLVHQRRREQSALGKLTDAAIASLMAPIYLLAQAAMPAARAGFDRTIWK